jgi:hypothetical protein
VVFPRFSCGVKRTKHTFLFFGLKTWTNQFIWCCSWKLRFIIIIIIIIINHQSSPYVILIILIAVVPKQVTGKGVLPLFSLLWNARRNGKHLVDVIIIIKST